MKTLTPFEVQRQYLRLRLQTNRKLLVQQTGSDWVMHDGDFPRSHTMRLLTQSPGLVTYLLAEAGAFLLGRVLAKPKRFG